MRLLTAATLLALFTCACTTQGPVPSVSEATNPLQPGRSPARLCNAQGNPSWRLVVSGSGFAPLPQGVLTATPALSLPTVRLEGPVSLTLPRERVFFSSASELVVEVPTGELPLEPGSYALTVTNPQGASGRLEQALVVVPPPLLERTNAPAGLSESSSSLLVLAGSGFRAGEPPSVVLRASNLPSVTLTDVTVDSSTEVRARLPAGTPPGTYDVEVSHPEGCCSTLPMGLVVSYPPPTPQPNLFALEPRFGWQSSNQPITLHSLTALGGPSFSGSAPELFLVAPLKADPSVSVDIPLRRVTVTSPTTLTAVVPTCSGLAAPLTDSKCLAGIFPGGPYALKVKERNGPTHQVPAAQGFSVLVEPAPLIDSLSPSAITTAGQPLASPLLVRGNHFEGSSRVQLLHSLGGGRVRACHLPTVGSPSVTEIRVQVPAFIAPSECVELTPSATEEPAQEGLTLTPGLYVVRVLNSSTPAFGQYSGLIVTRPDLAPVGGPLLSSLTKARADFPLVVATDDLGRPYVYALGGTDGTQPLDSVEMAPLTPFGDLGPFRTLERTPLDLALSGLSATARTVPGDTSYVFAIGGLQAGDVSVRRVARAQVLRSVDAPVLLPPELSAGGLLPEGTYYYRVSAVLEATHAKNPGGETLASEVEPVTVGSTGERSARLRWDCLPSAARYRIYRSVGANAASGSELLLDEVSALSCAGSPSQATYLDTGALQPAGAAPLPSGALGRWVAVGDMNRERAQTAARFVGNTLYVVGGFCGPVNNDYCVGATPDNLESVERATFDPSTATLGTFSMVGTSGNWLESGRRRHALVVADASSAPGSFNTGFNNSQDAWLLALGGAQNTTVFNNIQTEVLKVQSATGPLTQSFENAGYNSIGLHGGWAEIINNHLFYAGTYSSNSSTSFALRYGILCTNSTVDKCVNKDDFKGTLIDSGFLYQAGGLRFLGGSALFRAFIYVAGGFPSSAGGTPTATVERLTY